MPRAVPYALFFLSGISGLVYQVVWVRQFGNVFGNTVHSAALVTAVFMCGLGGGGYLAGAWADGRYARGRGALLSAYGGVEVLIGALGTALALLLPRLAGLSAWISSYARDARGWHELTLGSELLRYAVAAALLAPMTALMGGTLTLLIRHVVQGELRRAGLRIGALYGCNTAGAALGCFLTDFALVPRLGLLRAQLVAAAINAVVGVTALGLAARATPSATTAAAATARREPAAAEPAPDEGSPHAVVLTAAAIALTGFAGMGMEIVWFDRAGELDPTLAAARFGLGLALRRARRPDDAIAAYRLGLELAPRDVPGRLAVIDLLLQTGREREAEPELARVFALEPENGAAHAMVCVTLMRRDAIAEARPHCDRALLGGATLAPSVLERLGAR